MISTKRNAGLEPIEGAGVSVGYVPEIHKKDALEFTYKLPLGAIERLIRSYWEDIYECDSEWVYLMQVGSMGRRMSLYAERMLDEIKNQLNKHGLEGEKIMDEVYEADFKNKFEKMQRHHKNHPNEAEWEIKPCADSECCNYTKNFTYKVRILWRLLKLSLTTLRGWIPADKRFYITWY